LPSEWRRPVARVAAPIAFLAAVTIAVLLVYAGLNENSEARDRPRHSTASLTPTLPRTGAGGYYRIRRGDTLGDVADRFGTTVAVLLALNPNVHPSGLKIGQRIRVR
jgi:LysM domain-containing protein